jgi:hypothetical protein
VGIVVFSTVFLPIAMIDFPFCCSPVTLDITPAQLLLLTNSRLKFLGVAKAGHRYRILHHVKQLKAQPVVVTEPSPITLIQVFNADNETIDELYECEKSEAVGVEIHVPIVRGCNASIKSKLMVSKCMKRMLHNDFWRFDQDLCIFAPPYHNVFISIFN